MTNEAAPKLFVSYSWSNPDHEAWVLQLATSLVESGIDVIFDKWQLRDGHDSIKFMESMVTNPDVKKVVILADRVYVEKANLRVGGVGTETQILTPELYGGQDPDKFVLVVCEHDDQGKPYIPTYYRGRIHIDMSREDVHAVGHDQIVRWVFGKPLYVRPEIGARPAFLDEHFRVDLGTGAASRRCLDAITHGKPTALGSLTAYFDLFINNMERFRIERSSEHLFDDQVMQSIDDFLPFKNEILEIFNAIARYSHTGDYGGALHRFFEQFLEFTGRPQGLATYREEDWDNFKFFAHELFTSSVAIFLRFERFEFVSLLTTRQYVLPKSVRESGNEPVGGFDVLNRQLASFEFRKRRLSSKRLSLHADKLIERTVGSIIESRELCQADFILYVKCEILDSRWYPQTWIYIGEHSNTLEIFARACSAEYFKRVMGQLFNITDKDPLLAVANSGIRFNAGWSTLQPARLMGIDRLATKS
jgi:TIR domain